MTEIKDYFCPICKRHMHFQQIGLTNYGVYVCPNKHFFKEDELK